MITPGNTIGILGGGQLGRMLGQAAQTMGYRVHVFEPTGPCPAGAVANREVNAPYEDTAALAAFARECTVVTYEFENIPSGTLQAIAPIVTLHPKPEALHVCQNRQREKAWLRAHGFPHVRYSEALDGEVAAAIEQVGRPCVIKTADFGYDGKGQMKIVTDADLEQAATIFRRQRCVVERWVDFSCEISAIVARSSGGEVRVFPIAENIHTNHILDVSIVPARVSPAVLRDAEQLATSIAVKLGVVGLITVEMFATATGEVLVNELAPRPHNSGHWSLDGCETSQFEQHLRAICGMPLGGVTLREPTVMVNILGDAWQWRDGRVEGEPYWEAIWRQPRAKLHLYGKAQPQRGRKMGHFTVRDTTVQAALARAQELKRKLCGESQAPEIHAKHSVALS